MTGAEESGAMWLVVAQLLYTGAEKQTLKTTSQPTVLPKIRNQKKSIVSRRL